MLLNEIEVNATSKATKFLAAMSLVRETVADMKALKSLGLTWKEVDEVVFGEVADERHSDISGKVVRARDGFGWLRNLTEVNS